jgi:hypothetical protein
LIISGELKIHSFVLCSVHMAIIATCSGLSSGLSCLETT